MTAATDKGGSKAHLDNDSQTIDALVAAKNGYSQLLINWPGETPASHKKFDFVGTTVPDNTDYPDSIAPIGSTFLRLLVTAGAVSGAEEYIKRAAATWALMTPGAADTSDWATRLQALEDEILVADVVVTTAQLLALNAVPKTLVAAPAAGKILVPVLIQFFLDWNSIAYNGIAAGEDLAVRYTDGSGAICANCEATGFLDATADAHRVTPVQEVAFAPVAAAALVLHMTAGEIATGNSPLKVRTHYRVLDLQT